MSKWICAGLAGLLLAGCMAVQQGPTAVTGQIEAVTIRAGSRVGGRVLEVPVKEGDSVKAGDVLLRLDARDAQAAVAAAQAQLAQAEAFLAKLETGARPEEIRQAEANAKRAEEQFRLAEKGFRSQEVKAADAAAEGARAQRDEARADFERMRQLVEKDAVSDQAFERSKHALEAADAQYEAARQKLGLVAEGLRTEEVAMAKAGFDQAAAMLDLLRNGSRTEDVAAARAARDAAQAALDRAKVALDEMTVTAPRDAIIESLDLHPGDIIPPGAAVSLIDPEDLELVVYVSAALLGRIKVGETLELTTDSHGPQRFSATIAQIAAQGEFTPRNLQTQEERVQQVFGITLKLNSHEGRLRAGMAATAHFHGASGKP